MASGSEIVGAAGGAGGIIRGLVGGGQSQYNAQDISHSGMYNPNAQSFGQYGADNYQYGREQQAGAIDRRTAAQADYAQADQDRQNAAMARASQASVMGNLMARANGQTPSIAGMQGAQDAQRAVAAQSSLAASARGPAGMAIAQQSAANNAANAQSRISNTSQINAANERLQAEQAAFGAASGMRGQDYQSQGQAAQQSQYNAGLQQQNRAINDARANSLQQMGHNALAQQQQGAVQMQGIAAGSHAAAQQQNAQTERENAKSKGLIESAGDAIGDLFSDVSTKVPYIPSDFNMKTPFSAGSPALSMGGVKAGSGPSDGMTIGGGFHSGTGQLGPDGGMDTDFGTKWNNAEIQGMADDPTGGMAGGPAMMMSDARAKQEAFRAGVSAGQTMPAVTVEGVPPTKAAAARYGSRVPEGPTAYDDQEFENAKRRGPQYRANLEASDEDTRQMKTANLDRERKDEQRKDMQEKMTPASLRARGFTRAAEEMEAEQAARQPKPASPPAPSMMASLMGSGIRSDFRAKQGLSGPPVGMTNQQWADKDPEAFDNWADKQGWSGHTSTRTYEQADPGKGQFRYVPGRGWIGPDDEQKQALDAAMAKEADRGEPGDHNDDAYWNQRVADNDRKLAQQAEWQRAADEESEPKADDGQRMAPGTADFQKTEPKGDSADARGNKPWWMGLQSASKSLNEPQFGVKSDRRAKEVIDLDGVDVDNDPGGQDFDADEYLESKAPKPYEREGVTVRHDTKAERSRIKREGEDRASRDADDMMAGYQASLGKDNAVASRLGPERSPVAEANRTMVGSMYRYKPQFTPPEQKPGEPNFGFMAQNLEKSPITATAVKEDPNGLKRVDALKLLRILGASVADLQEQQDETRLALSKGGRK